MTRRGALTRVTTAPGPDIYPVWSPDGRQIVYAGRGDGGFDLWQVPTTGTGSDTVLYGRPGVQVPLDWSSDGRFILFADTGPSGSKLMALPASGDDAAFDVARSREGGGSGVFSPDGMWVAFESDETGSIEVYVQPFPGPGPKRVISIGGGLQPQWGPDGRELFYVAADGRLTAVALRPGPGATLEPAQPVPLFPSRIENTVTGGVARNYVVSKDGTFLLNQFVEQEGEPITLILNLGAR